jgi:nitrate reductase assembly molybdenum cofactor insertion protein NarJ
MTLARLLTYPGPDYKANAAACCPEFARAIEPMSVEELQEAWVRTFEMAPECSLDIGWHLFGENYERGEFLVMLRQELRRHGISESSELPDHLSHVLPLLDRIGDRRAFSDRFLLPALDKILAGAAGSPFQPLLRAVRNLEAS